MENGKWKIEGGRSHRAGNRFSILDSRFSVKKSQVTLEFVFCMIVLFLMMYAIVMVFRWVGLDLGQRQKAHEAVLTADEEPLKQIDPYFYTPAAMNAVWRP